MVRCTETYRRYVLNGVVYRNVFRRSVLSGMVYRNVQKVCVERCGVQKRFQGVCVEWCGLVNVCTRGPCVVGLRGTEHTERRETVLPASPSRARGSKRCRRGRGRTIDCTQPSPSAFSSSRRSLCLALPCTPIMVAMPAFSHGCVCVCVCVCVCLCVCVSVCVCV